MPGFSCNSWTVLTNRSSKSTTFAARFRSSYFFRRKSFLRKKYEERKRAANVVDFDDLLVKTVQLLQENPGIAEFYQRHFQFILVDEYQDTNKLQSGFIDLLAAHHQSVMVVGDDAQSIYSWRGANYQNILDFPKRYPSAAIHKIETNYRSVPEVLKVANAAIQPNARQFSKILRPDRKETDPKPALVPA